MTNSEKFGFGCVILMITGFLEREKALLCWISEILTIEFTRRNWVASNNDLPQLHGKIGNGK